MISALGVICPICGMNNCTMDHATTAGGKSVMIMGGIPLDVFVYGVVGVLLISFVASTWLRPHVAAGFRLNLIKSKRLYKIVRNRWFQAIPQLLMVGILIALIYIGLAGSRIANLTPVAVWTIWWAALIFAVLLLGTAWCFMCPWDGIANLVTRQRLASRSEPLTLGWEFPEWLKNVYPAIGLFIVLTWLELGYGVTTNPRTTAYLGIGMVMLAVGSALMFRGKEFCQHLCPVGRICGIYSRFAPVEISNKRQRVCDKCKTEDCLNGNELGYACPTGVSLRTMTSTSECIGCTECIKSCRKQNVALNLRPFGSELRHVKLPKLDEAWLALALLTLTFFHGISMTPFWEDHRPGRDSILKWMGLHLGTSRVVNFTIAMAFACVIPIAAYWLCCRLGARWARSGVSARKLFVTYAYSLLPVALFYHLSHNLMHLGMEGGHIVPMLSDPMGNGSNYFGTKGMNMTHLLSGEMLWFLQVGLILTGHIFGIVVAHRAALRTYQTKSAAVRSLIPMLVLMIIISIGGLWLMHMDMNMRVGRM